MNKTSHATQKSKLIRPDRGSTNAEQDDSFESSSKRHMSA